MSGCEAKQPSRIRGLWLMCGLPVAAVHDYSCPCGHVTRMGTCGDHRPAGGEVGCARCWDQGHECPVTAVLVSGPSGLERDDPAEDDGPAPEAPPVVVEAAGGLEVCDLCGFPAVRVNGRWVHAEVADSVFCALFHPRARGVGSGGSE